MKFRYKVTLCMISMIAFIFGIGGTFLLYSSFPVSYTHLTLPTNSLV